VVRVGPETGRTSEIEARLLAIWQELLDCDDVGPGDNFFDAGGTSVLAMQLRARIEAEFGERLAVSDLFRFPTIRDAATRLAGTAARERMADAGPAPTTPDSGIAIVGMSGRFPGAPTVDALWARLCAGDELIVDVPEPSGAGSAERSLGCRPVGRRGLLADVELFDAAFFGIAPREAEVIDPQHRLFLECAYEALESAGYSSARGSRVGVFAGASTSGYAQRLDGAVEAVGREQMTIGTDKDFLATRVSYKLGLTGPSLTIQTGCSTSLVAVHVACRALLDGECDVALAGGVGIVLPHDEGYVYAPGGILAPDGHCRPFAADSAGTVPGDGVGVVVLRRLEEALESGDHIVAVIRGSAVNNDGADKVGYTAASVGGHAAVIAAALSMSGFTAASIGYVEAHGTGTRLGDPVEVAALAQALGGSSGRSAPCALGSIKSNVGHLDTAAGVTGLIKAALIVERGFIPPSLHAETPNPELRLEETPFELATAGRAWPSALAPRRAGVSSLGIGGTNAHVVLEQPPARGRAAAARPWELLTVSARTGEALGAARERLADHVISLPAAVLPDTAFTLSVGRERLPHRSCVVASTPAGAAAALRRTVRKAEPVSDVPKVAFLLPGQGAQRPGAAAAAYGQEPRFRAAFDHCADRLGSLLPIDLRELLVQADPRDLDADAALRETMVAQPALIMLAWACAAVWRDWGLAPAGLLGHSIGELAAACLAGVFSIDDALALAVERGRVMQACPRGAMLAVALSEQQLRERIAGTELAVAAVNAPALTVASGPFDAIAHLERTTADTGVLVRRLRTSHAFHSPLMEDAVEGFHAAVMKVTPEAPRIPFVSNVTGDWISAAEAMSPRYWATHVRAPVQFAAGAARLAGPGWMSIEVGPGDTLAKLMSQRSAGQLPAVTSLPGGDGGDGVRAPFADAAAKLVERGVELDWERFHGGGRRRVPLPTYPFERCRHWASAGPRERSRVGSADEVLPADRWISTPSWARGARLAPAPADPAEQWLVVGRAASRTEALVGALERAGATVARAPEGSLQERRGSVLHVVHLIDADDARSLGQRTRAGLAATQRAVAAIVHANHPALRAHVVGARLAAVMPGEDVDPAGAAVIGLLRVLAQEHPALRLRAVDAQASTSEDAVAAELLVPPQEPIVALRGRTRWLQRFEVLRDDDEGTVSDDANSGRAVHLVTGAFGALGSLVAEHLAARGAAVALMGRPGTSAARQRALARRCEAHGARTLIVEADVADRVALGEAVATIERVLGPIERAVHAAGVTGDEAFGPALELDPAVAEAHLRAKVDGTLALFEVLGAGSLRRCVLMSSLAGLLGGLGYGPYAAANAFQDAFAVSRDAAGDQRWISAAWDGWALENAARPELLSSADGLAALDRVWDLVEPHVVVAKTALARRFDVWARPTATKRAPSFRDHVDRAGGGRPIFVHPTGRSDAAGQIAAVLADVLGIDAMERDDDFFALGGHSLLAVQAALLITQQLREQVTVQTLIDRRTPQAIAAALDSGGVATRHAIAPVVLRKGPTEGTLVLVHPVGGEIECYRTLVDALSWDGLVVALRGADLTAVNECELVLGGLADAALVAISDAVPAGPLAIAGWSFGGVLAFEIARRLDAAGRPASEIVLLDAPCPLEIEQARAVHEQGEGILLAAFAMEEAERLGMDVSTIERCGCGGSFDDVAAAMQDAGLWHGDPAALHALVAGYGRRIAAMERLDRAPWPGAITFVSAPEPTRDLLQTVPTGTAQTVAAWERLAEGGVRHIGGAGSHTTMLSRPHVDTVAAALDTRLSRLQTQKALTGGGRA
jgi:acyl transferase domain-containing protein/thioesterase domain-containing protein/acyl carrier protein